MGEKFNKTKDSFLGIEGKLIQNLLLFLTLGMSIWGGSLRFNNLYVVYERIITGQSVYQDGACLE